MRYSHPSRFGWIGESWEPGEIDSTACGRIRRDIRRRVLPASVWRRVDSARVVERQRALRLPSWVLNGTYSSFVAARNALESRSRSYRLVEKSVHAGLWPGLPARVFPDATLVHVVRDPWRTLASMERGWHDWQRFRAYRLPEALRIPDCASPEWCFPLPRGWQSVIDRRLAEVVAFQWCAIQGAILDHIKSSDAPSITLRLEDLAADPKRELRSLAAALGLPWDGHLEGLATDLPQVNAGQSYHAPIGREAIRDPALLAEIEGLADRFGY